MVRVLRHNRRPEESGLSAEELERKYGYGKFLDQQTYICALPEALREALEKINAAPDLPAIDHAGDASLSILIWLSRIRRLVSPWANAIGSALPSLLDEEWAERVRAAPAPPLLLVTPPASPPVQRVALSTTSALVQGWESTYEDPLGVVDYLGGVVDGYMAEWRTDSRHHAAWTMVVQSSGWGKSRSIQQLTTKGFHVAYVSFMARTATGIPSRSAVADVLSDPEDPRCIAAWVLAILLQIGNSTPEEWSERQKLKPGELTPEETEELQQLRAEVTRRYKTLLEDVKLRVDYKGDPSGTSLWRPDRLREWIGSKLSDVFCGAVEKVVFCLDEGASLFNQRSDAFLAFRRFFSAIPRVNLFGLVVDTAGQLGLVFPLRRSDPSMRAIDPTAKFFEPVWTVGSAYRDLKKLQRLLSDKMHLAFPTVEGRTSVVSEEFTRELFRMGRPLWRAMLDNWASLDSAAQFAGQKLLNGVSPATVLGATVTPEMAAAVVGVVAGLEVAACDDLARDMVARHMRSISHVGRDGVFTGDVIEPILGEAAAGLLACDELLVLLLKRMVGVLKQPFAVEGHRGEIVGRLILVLAMHRCLRRPHGGAGHERYSHPVPLAAFLSQLSGRTVMAKGFVFFNRFMFLNRPEINRDHLLSAFVCGFAIIPQGNHAGFDVLLPCLVPGPDGGYQLLPERMRAVPVQIRNRQESQAVQADMLLESAEEEDEDDKLQHYFDIRPPQKMRTLKKEENVIELQDECGLYLHVQEKRGAEHQVEVTVDSRVLVLRGVRFPGLEETVAVELENMCNAFFKLEDQLEVDPGRGKFFHHNFNDYRIDTSGDPTQELLMM